MDRDEGRDVSEKIALGMHKGSGKLSGEAMYDSPFSGAVCENLARLLLLKIQQQAEPFGRRFPRSFTTYERLRNHIETHYLRLRSVEDIARECHVTTVHVARLFGRFGRTGAYEFLLRLKMNYAAELLENGLLVKEAAQELDFADAFQFSRAFKRIHGVPPGAFKESRLAERVRSAD